MIPREAEGRLKALSRQFPIVVVSGPRQAGKTTLVRATFPDKPYFNLERPDVRDRVVDDPAGFLSSCRGTGAIIDEAQRFPGLSSWLQSFVDELPGAGQFFLTGSNQPLLRSQVNQTLVGRAAWMNLLPFSATELSAAGALPGSTDELLAKGFYPPLYDRPFDPVEWLAQYVQTYVERDVAQLTQVKDWSSFHRFLRLCAGRTGQVLNLSDLARDADVSHTTARHWLSLLEAGYLVFLLPPWHENYQKRLVKSPKLYFYDVGLASWLAGVREPTQWPTHPLRGPFFETMVIADRIRRSWAQGPGSEWFFWASPSGLEVDLLELRGTEVLAYEVKSGATFRPDQGKNLAAWATLASVPRENLTILYDGTESFSHQGMVVKPWKNP